MEAGLPLLLLLCIVYGWKTKNRTVYLIGSLPVGIIATVCCLGINYYYISCPDNSVSIWWSYMDDMECSPVPGWTVGLLYLQLTTAERNLYTHMCDNYVLVSFCCGCPVNDDVSMRCNRTSRSRNRLDIRRDVKWSGIHKRVDTSGGMIALRW
jgi:hypothetical protein